MIVLAVELEIDPDQVDEFKERLSKHADNSRGEEGCRGFDMAQDRKDPTKIYIWERYRDMEAVDDHANSPHLAEFRELTKDMVKNRTINVARSVR